MKTRRRSAASSRTATASSPQAATFAMRALAALSLSTTAAHAGNNPVCGEAATHDCFSTGDPGCTDETCCDAVCACDPFCCSEVWDVYCAGAA